MTTRLPATAPRREAVNVASMLVIVSLCLAVSIFAVMRLTHRDLWSLPGLTRATASHRASPAPRTATAPADPQPLELHVDQSNPVNVLAPGEQPSPTSLPPLPEVVSQGSPARPIVALTFDTNMTALMVRALDRGTVKRFVNDSVIAELRQLRVPATFFMSGLWIERYPDVARDIAADPLFEVANHSFSSQAFRRGCFQLDNLDLSRATDDLARAETLLSGIAAHPTPYFRFPGGCYDAASLAAIRPAHLQVLQYDVVAGDASTTDPATIIAHTVSSAQAGSIVALNVTGGNAAPATAEALPEIVKQLRARGFELVRVTDILQAGGAR